MLLYRRSEASTSGVDPEAVHGAVRLVVNHHDFPSLYTPHDSGIKSYIHIYRTTCIFIK
jgi:hypothetical protein